MAMISRERDCNTLRNGKAVLKEYTVAEYNTVDSGMHLVRII